MASPSRPCSSRASTASRSAVTTDPPSSGALKGPAGAAIEIPHRAVERLVVDVVDVDELSVVEEHPRSACRADSRGAHRVVFLTGALPPQQVDHAPGGAPVPLRLVHRAVRS